MENMLVPTIAAAAVALLVYGVAQLFMGSTARENKKRLQERLGTDAIARAEARLRRGAWVEYISNKLSKAPGMAALDERLQQVWPRVPLAMFVGIVVACGATAFAIGAWATSSALLGTGFGAAAAMGPNVALRIAGAKRQRRLEDQLPDALDYLARILRAGHSFSTGLQMMADELPQPLAGELRRCYDAHSFGQALEDALRDTARRIGSSDFAFFVTAVLIQRQTGGDLSEVLNNIGQMVRSRMRLQQHVKAKTAEGRFTGNVLVAFPILMFVLTYVLNPEYATQLLHGTGLYLLGTAAGLVVLGLFTIRRITTVKV